MENIIFSIAIVLFIAIILSNLIIKKVNIPSFLIFLVLGICLGPYCLNILNIELIELNQEIATFAIVILIIRAGFGVNRDSIRKVGRPAIGMSFIPAVFEGISLALISHYFLNIPLLEAGLLGFAVAAVSPAILVPGMLNLIEKGLGVAKGIPTLLLAGSATDDVTAITIFSIFLGIYTGSNVNIFWEICGIPISLILGILSGVFAGGLLIFLFRKLKLTTVQKLLLTLAVGIFLDSLSELLSGKIPIAGLVGVMLIGFLIMDKMPEVGKELSESYNGLWYFAEIILFVLLGAQVNIPLVKTLIIPGIIIISLGLLFRSLGVYISLLNTNFNNKEKLFCMVSFIPKATVPAALGSIPLAYGIPSGEIILAISCISIIYAAPLGAILMNKTQEKLLT
jgi:NhaP-type Na+/H+ or K+/H+ antiporter